MDDLKATIEALVFVSETPVTLGVIEKILEGIPRQDISSTLNELIREYEERGGAYFCGRSPGDTSSGPVNPWLHGF